MWDMISREFVSSIQSVSGGVMDALPRLIVAIIFIAIGWIFGTAVGKVVQQIVEAVKADEWLRKAGVDTIVRRVGYELNVGRFLGTLSKLFFIIVMLVAAFDILGLNQVNSFLTQVLAYIPEVVVAAIILFVASLASDLLGDMVHGTTRALGSRVAHLLGSVTRVAIWVFAVIMALSQLGIATQYMFTLFTGFVAMVAIAGGLAFGLGGKDAAADLIKEIRTEIKEKR